VRNQTTLRLSTLAGEIAGARAELARLQESLEAQDAVLGDCEVRMLIAETPLADRDLHVAAADRGRIAQEVARAQEALDRLRSEERRLTVRLASAGA
jgi:chromosome segregation ATPase